MQDTGFVDRLIVHSPLLADITQVDFLDEGFSDDRKYVLSENGAARFLVRFSDVSVAERRRGEFECLRQHRANGVRCSEPYLFEVDESNGVCYSVLSFIPGSCAEKTITSLPDETQYAIGLEAGRELRLIHQMEYPDPDYDWVAHREAKNARHWKKFHDHGFSFPGQHEVEAFVNRHLYLLRNRPIRFQHDDFHLGNLIINDGGLAGIIDFNRCDWGDPYEDFLKIPMFTSPVSLPFARGQIRGYFSGDPPDTFWPLYNLYVAMPLGMTLVWFHRREPEDLDWWVERLDDIVTSHDFSDGGPPQWWS